MNKPYYHITAKIFKSATDLIQARLDLEEACDKLNYLKGIENETKVKMLKGLVSTVEWQLASIEKQDHYYKYCKALEVMEEARKSFKENTTFLFLMHAGNDIDLIEQAKTVTREGITAK